MMIAENDAGQSGLMFNPATRFARMSKMVSGGMNTAPSATLKIRASSSRRELIR
jgi:hypothetical protein